MNKENHRAYKIVSHQFLTLVRVEFSAAGNHPPLGAVVEALQRRNIPIRFISSDLSAKRSVTFNIGVDLLGEETTGDVLQELGSVPNRREAAIISQVSMAMIYGPHFGEIPGIAAAALSTLDRAGIIPLAATASASSLSYLFPSPQFKIALELLTGLFQPPEVAVNWKD